MSKQVRIASAILYIISGIALGVTGSYVHGIWRIVHPYAKQAESQMPVAFGSCGDAGSMAKSATYEDLKCSKTGIWMPSDGSILNSSIVAQGDSTAQPLRAVPQDKLSTMVKTNDETTIYIKPVCQFGLQFLAATQYNRLTQRGSSGMVLLQVMEPSAPSRPMSCTEDNAVRP